MWVLLLSSSSSVHEALPCDVTCSFFSSSLPPSPPSREHTGLSTSPRNQSSPTSASKPTSPKRPTMILSGGWLTSSSQGNLSLHFLSIRCVIAGCFPLLLDELCACAPWLIWLSLQSSKCRSVFSSAQKLEGYKRLDRQLAQFNDYNFVFTSYAQHRQQNQQSWGCVMKRRKKRGGCWASTQPPSFCLSISPWAAAATSPPFSSSFSCLHCASCKLDILHERSSLCFAILAHSCCDLEVHVEELNRLCFRPSTSATQSNGPFLQVSPLVLHRQGFRAH